MIDIVGLYDSLITATYAGIPFEICDTSRAPGRRLMRFLFPGVDAPIFQDLGVDNGMISVRGVLQGDDFVQQANRLEAALALAGPQTLFDPFNGSVQVVLAQPAKLSFDTRELRICRIELSLYRYVPPAPLSPDTLSGLIGKIRSTIADAKNWMAAELAPAAGALAAFGYAQGLVSQAAGYFNAAILGAGSTGGAIAAACGDEIAALGVPVAGTGASWAASTAGLLAAVPAAIAGACTPLMPASVAPGGATTAAAASDPAATTAVLLSVLPDFAAGASAAAPAPAVNAAMNALILANACQAASNISYDSQQAAIAQGQTLYVALDAGINAAALAAATAPSTAAPVWRDLIDLKAALAADLNSRIGRLPPVINVKVPTSLPVWLLAQYVSGDTPSDVCATYQDIIARNRIRHPALAPSGSIEVLAPT